MDRPPRKDLTLPAGSVLGVITIALFVAALFNSEAIVRAGESMQNGTTRDVVLSVGRPLDDVAGAVGLHLPREDSTRPSARSPRRRRAPSWRRARPRSCGRTGARPPAVVPPAHAGGSGGGARDRRLAGEFIGELLTDLLPQDLYDVEVVARNATGLTNPEFFNWEINAQQEIDARQPDAVVLVMGGNDGFNVVAPDGQLYGPQDPQWQTEYARRAAVVMRELSSDGERPVYWVPPPTARDPEFNVIYQTQNRAIEQAAAAVPGARYVDIYSTINKAATATS